MKANNRDECLFQRMEALHSQSGHLYRPDLTIDHLLLGLPVITMADTQPEQTITVTVSKITYCEIGQPDVVPDTIDIVGVGKFWMDLTAAGFL